MEVNLEKPRMGSIQTSTVTGSSKRLDPDCHYYQYYDGSWDDFPGQVRTYIVRPVPRIFCESRQYEKMIEGCMLSSTFTDYYGFGIETGMEEARLLTVKGLSLFFRLREQLFPGQHGVRLSTGDILLEMNGEPMCGSGIQAPYYMMEKLWEEGALLRVTVVSSGLLNNRIDVSGFLNDNVFPKYTLQYEVQLCLRVALYSISAPVTNRPRRKDDLDRRDGGYLFVTNEELYRWLERQYFVEHGEYEGYFYGTIWPCQSRILVSEEDQWKFVPMTEDCVYTDVAPLRGRRMSFKKAVGMIPKDSEEDVAFFDLEPRSRT